MLRAAIANGTAQRYCVFEAFARHLPRGRRYGVVAGLDRILEAVEAFTFSPDQVLSLLEREVIDIPTAKWLSGFRFTVAVLIRNTQPSEDLPGVAEELARRRLREEYRALARRDPSLARNLRVGRPDLPRNLDDGGLLDLNALPAEQLTTFAGLSPEEATSVADARHHLGRFTSLNELALYADLSEPTTAMLSEHAVFI
ncbi:hypothetical protein FC770_11705 [Nocardioides jishulii]|uniref:Nicotinate phosphoribosyltransferase N-terminal domain-containing protein n=2 Tax=Nocardioides jishulii TaxID=2575440 RepID=A0A4U2YLQ8_9ACTN|nr:hypothetical protein FCL41_05070 [Nocardioides jishulii]TKI61452.1 hypothetical protein FC770_11705 [Nocardioides jishulii]